MLPIIEQARQVAIKAHGEQKYGEQPYVVHLDAVSALLAEYGVADPVTHCVAYLHDTLEDTKLTCDRIEDLFDEEVSGMVAFCTDEDGNSRRIRKRDTYARIRKVIDMQPLPQVIRGVLVKVADRLANIRSCVRDNPSLLSMYRKEQDAFKAALRIKQKHPQLDRMWTEYEELLALKPARGVW